MFVTTQLLQQIADTHAFAAPYIRWLEEHCTKSEGIVQDFSTCLAAERALHIATESLTDSANLVIDALVMRDPGGYLDIIKVLAEESVVTAEWFSAFEGCLELRGKLVHKYRLLSPTEIASAVSMYGPLFQSYYEQLNNYLASQQ